MFITLSNGQTVEVPEGAEPAAFKRWQENKLRLQILFTISNKQKHRSKQ